MPVAESQVQIALKRILVATDFSEGSKRALLTGLGIAQRYASGLHVVHVVPSEGYGVAGVGMLGAVNFARHNVRNLESEFLQKGYFEGIRYQISVERGEVWPAVSRMVEEEDIDLVVVGTRGRTGLGRLLLPVTTILVHAYRRNREPCHALLVNSGTKRRKNMDRRLNSSWWVLRIQPFPHFEQALLGFVHHRRDGTMQVITMYRQTLRGRTGSAGPSRTPGTGRTSAVKVRLRLERDEGAITEHL